MANTSLFCNLFVLLTLVLFQNAFGFAEDGSGEVSDEEFLAKQLNEHTTQAKVHRLPDDNLDPHSPRPDLSEPLKYVSNKVPAKEAKEETVGEVVGNLVNMSAEEVSRDLKSFITEYEKNLNILARGNLDVVEQNVLADVDPDTPFETVLKLLKIITALDQLCNRNPGVGAFINLSGFERVVYPTLESGNKYIAGEIFVFLQTMFNGNETAREYALKSGCIDKFIASFDKASSFTSRRLNLKTLGVLLRKNPKAQQEFVDVDGHKVFYKFMTKKGLKLKLKIINLLVQILKEHQDVLKLEMRLNATEEQTVLKNEYAKVGLWWHFANEETCTLFVNVLQEAFDTDPDCIGDISKIVQAIELMEQACLERHRDNYNLVILLQKMHSYYVNQIENTGDYGEMTDETDRIVRLISDVERYGKSVSNYFVPSKDEL